MSAISVLDNEYATVVYHPDKKIIHHTFREPIGGEKFQHVLKVDLECFEKGATKLLSDDRLNSVLSAEDTKWATKTWFKWVQAAGWKSWALVVPHDLFARLNLIEHVNHYSRRGIRVMVFTNPEEAFTWLDTLED